MDIPKLQKAGNLGPGSDKTRLIVLIVLTAVVIAAFIYFRIDSMQEEPEIVTDENYANIPAPQREVYAKVDPAELEEVKDGVVSERIVKEREPFLHLMSQAAKLIPGDMEALGVEILSPSKALEQPANFRGRPFSVKGNLQWFEEEEFEDFEYFRGYLTTLDGEYIYFTVLRMPNDLEIGDVVRLQGFFFKTYSFLLSDEETRVSDALFIVGMRLIPSFYTMEPAREINMDLLSTLIDSTLEDSSIEFQEKPLFHLLSYVQNMDRESYESIVFEERLATEVRNNSPKYRGAALDVVGQLVWLQDSLLGPEGENPLGIKKAFRGLVFNNKGGFCYFFALDLPEWLSLQNRDLVHLKGFFFRNYTFINRQGRTQSVPTLVVGGIDKFIIPEDNTMLMVTFFILGMTLFLLGFFFFTVFRDRRRNREYRAQFIRKKKAQLEQALKNAKKGPAGT